MGEKSSELRPPQQQQPQLLAGRAAVAKEELLRPGRAPEHQVGPQPHCGYGGCEGRGFGVWGFAGGVG